MLRKAKVPIRIPPKGVEAIAALVASDLDADVSKMAIPQVENLLRTLKTDFDQGESVLATGKANALIMPAAGPAVFPDNANNYCVDHGPMYGQTNAAGSESHNTHGTSIADGPGLGSYGPSGSTTVSDRNTQYFI